MFRCFPRDLSVKRNQNNQRRPKIKPSVTHPSLLHALCHHDDVVDAVLPHHPPEIVLGAGQRALGGDVLPAEVVALQHTHTEERAVSVCTSVCAV